MSEFLIKKYNYIELIYNYEETWWNRKEDGYGCIIGSAVDILGFFIETSKGRHGKNGRG